MPSEGPLIDDLPVIVAELSLVEVCGCCQQAADRPRPELLCAQMCVGRRC